MGKIITDLKIGDIASFSKTISESDISLFAGISGDFNPLHIDYEAIKKTKFKGRIAHGLLSASLISAVIGTKLPGVGTLYLKQDLNFIEPVFAGDTIKAFVEILDIDFNKKIVKLKTYCRNQHNSLVIDGLALVKPPLFCDEETA